MPIYDLICKNGHEQRDRLLKLGQRPPCPECNEPTETLWDQSAGVISDDIPGGIEIRHGLCNPDGTPRRYYSHTEIRKEAERRGLVNIVEHAPGPGSDKSRHTTRWT
jgi:hypothetical protein